MSRFVLQPCKIREDRVVPTKDDPIILNAKKLVAKFVPSGNRIECLKLRQARIGSYVGRAKGSRTGKEVLFIIWNEDRSNKIRWILKRDEAFPDRLLEIYRLNEVDWGSRFEEKESGKKDRLPGDRAVPRARMREM